MRRSILLVGNYPPPYGGVPTHVAYLAPFLAERGWNVHVVSLNGNPSFGSNADERRGAVQIHRPSKSLRVAALPGSGVALLRAGMAPAYMASHRGTAALAAYLYRLVCRHDIKLISAYHLLPAAAASTWAARAAGIPLVASVFGEIYDRLELYLAEREDIRRILDTSHALLSCSEHCARSIQLVEPTASARSVYYGVDTEFFRPEVDASSIRKRMGVPAEQPVVLFLARMNRLMGLDVLLDAIPRVLKARSDVRFLIAGGQDELSDQALTVARASNGTVHALPNVPFSELPACYNAATLFVAPSVNERACLGLAPIEAMSCARPALVSDVGGGREVIQDGRTGRLVSPRDPEALAGGILELVSMPTEERIEMGAEGRRLVLARFDKNDTNRAMEAIFLDAVGAKRGLRRQKR